MADETTHIGEETSWWAFDAFADSELPSTPFDEPLEWPDTLDWGDFATGDGDLLFPSTDELPSEPIFPEAAAPPPPQPAPAAESSDVPGDGGDLTMPHVTVLAGLGGSAASRAVAPAGVGAGDQADHDRLPDSLWAPEPSAAGHANGHGRGNGVAPAATTAMAAPTFDAEPERGAGGWRRRFDLRHGNAAIIALISFVSLVLLGMFMSVRARNDLPDTSQTRTTSDQIAVQGPLNTIPLTTTVTTLAPQGINIADLVPPPEDSTAVTSGGSTATTVTARATPAASTATTQPAPQSTATTAPPQATTTQPQTTTAPTTPPVVDQTAPTVPRRTSPTFPTITSTIPDDDTPSIPTIPGFPNFPDFPSNN